MIREMVLTNQPESMILRDALHMIDREKRLQSGRYRDSYDDGGGYNDGGGYHDGYGDAQYGDQSYGEGPNG